MDVSVVVPVFNEEESVELLCRQLHDALSGLGMSYELLLVDDGSSDNTWDRLVELRSEIPCLGLICFRRNFGQTAAMSAGFHKARGDVIVTLDADLQNDPADIPLLLKEMGPNVDVVSGWRKNRKDRFLDRRLPSMIANRVISRFTGVGIHDFGCTLKAYRREVIQNVHLYGEMHRFIPAFASWVGGKVVEVEVNHRARQFGTSKYGIARTLRVVLDLITVKFLMRYSTGPIQIFGKIAVLFLLPGILLLLLMILANGLYHFGVPNAMDSLIKRPFWVMTSFLLIFMGMQFISMGLLAEMQVRTYHESQNKPIYLVREALDPSDEG